MSYYFQESWKTTPRLTVNLGLRYDRTFLPPFGKEDTIGQHGGIETGGLDLNRGVYILQKQPPSCEERGHAPCIPGGKLPDHVVVDPRGKLLTDTTTNWGPRVGLAYRLNQTTADVVKVTRGTIPFVGFGTLGVLLLLVGQIAFLKNLFTLLHRQGAPIRVAAAQLFVAEPRRTGGKV